MSADRNSHICRWRDVAIETYVDGEGPGFVILPSYGRDGGTDYDDITGRLVAEGWKVLRPQPRGVAGSTGPMSGLTLHDLADDVARSVRALSEPPVVMLGHAFGNVLARVVTTDHPDLVRAVVLAAAEGSQVPPDIRQTPFIAGDPSRPEGERLDALRRAFFAPSHDARPWLTGWYPETLRMEHEAVKTSRLTDSWACGSVPLLQIIAEHDPFLPRPLWNEMEDQFAGRVTRTVVADASHALFPEQPAAVAGAILPWAARQGGGPVR